jgi:hypothetical protein
MMMEATYHDSRVDPDLVSLRRVVTQVLDVAQDVSLMVLAESVAKDGTDCQVDRSRLLDRPMLNREALDENEAWPVHDQGSD